MRDLFLRIGLLTGLLLGSHGVQALEPADVFAKMGITPSAKGEKQVKKLIRQYRRGKSHKALAVTIGNGGKYVVGMGMQGQTEVAASVTALQQCETHKSDHSIETPCEILLLGDTFVQRGAALRSGIGGDDPAMVWKIEDQTGKSMFLAGTIHVLKSTLYPLPPAFQVAYDASERIALETNILLSAEPSRTARIQELARTDAAANKAAMGKKLKKALAKFVKAHAGNMDAVYRTSPALNALQVGLARYAALGYQAAHGIDLHFAHRASTDGKPILELEDFVAGLIPLTGASLEVQHTMLEASLKEPEVMLPSVEQMIQLFAHGKANELADLLIQQFREEGYEPLLESFLDARNQVMFESMVSLLSEPETTFAMVGAAHVDGPTGILSLLHEAGFTVQQLNNRGEVYVPQ